MNIATAFTFLLCLAVSSAQNYTFPAGFRFGLATAAYQIEGAWNENGKGENIWDRLTHENGYPNADVSCDSYHNFKQDVQILKQLGVNFYRFSLSWSRILPTGYANYVNPDGIRYYNDLINELLANGITPMVTLYHWDLPQPLQEIGGWPNELIADLFTNYARIAYQNFGDRVKEWLTFNEPAQTCELGYAEGVMAPAYNSSGIADYMCSRTLILAHAKAWRLYDTEFRATQKGRVSITIDTNWKEPENAAAQDDAEREMQMNFGWWTNPIYSQDGDFPAIMYERVNKKSQEEGFPRSRLKPFTPAEVALIKGTYDYFGLNHYTTLMVADGLVEVSGPSHWADTGCITYYNEDWPASAASWLYVVPWGFRNLLNWIKNHYGNIEIIVTENGYADPDSAGLNDCARINYYNSYLEQMWLAMYEDGVNVSGYTAWSLVDNFEWREGYSQRFGLTYVDFNSPARTRTLKQSAGVYANIIKTRKIDRNFTPSGFQPCP